MKKVMWVSSAELLPKFLAAGSDEDRYAYVTLSGEDCDMTEYNWIRVGVAEIFTEYQTGEEVKRLALQEVEKAIEKKTAEFAETLEALKTFRSTLLCLEAPK